MGTYYHASRCHFHFDVGSTISSGHALAASAYRERTGDYAERGGHVSGGLVGWDGEACDLWAAAERADTPKRKRVEVSTRPRTIARQITIALPDALDPSSREKTGAGLCPSPSGPTWGCGSMGHTRTRRRRRCPKSSSSNGGPSGPLGSLVL